MPELPVKEIRLPELHLPEISREEILKTVSEVRRPDLELPKMERPKIEMPDVAMPRFGAWKMPRIDMPAIDLAKVVASAIAAVGIARPRSRWRLGRSGWAIVAGVLVAAGVSAFVISRNQAARARVETATRRIGSKITEMREGAPERLEFDRDDPDVTSRMTVDETDMTAATNGSGLTDIPTSAGAVEESEAAEPNPMTGATEMTDVASEPAPGIVPTGERSTPGSNGTTIQAG